MSRYGTKASASGCVFERGDSLHMTAVGAFQLTQLSGITVEMR
jgi:hypothetical protein